jgi:hypothetical protein
VMRVEDTDYREPLSSLLQGEGVVGVARLVTTPAFTGSKICTLVFTAKRARISVVDARRNFPVVRVATDAPIEALAQFGPFASWKKFRVAAVAAPSFYSSMLDGIGYTHGVADANGAFEANWSNPDRDLHKPQCDLVSAYYKLVAKWRLWLQTPFKVCIRTGRFAALSATVETLQQRKGMITVMAELAGKTMPLELAPQEVEIATEYLWVGGDGEVAPDDDIIQIDRSLA